MPIQRRIEEEVKEDPDNMLQEEVKENELFSPAAESDNHQKLRILCVDDSAYNLLVMKMLLEKIDKDMKIDTAMHGLDAVAKVVD